MDDRTPGYDEPDRYAKATSCVPAGTATPTKLGEVTIDLNSTGTSVEIRSAQTPTPSSLSDTTVLTPATPLRPGSNTIKVDNASPTSNLLVWVSTLGQVNGESRSDIAEITVKAAS